MAIFRKIFIFLLGFLKRIFIKLFIFVLIVYLLITGLRITPQTLQADFCVSCHEMKPEYVTFKASAHNQFSCTVCHKDFGLQQMFQQKDFKLVTCIVEYFTKTYKLPFQSKKPMPNSICESCHSLSRTITPRGDIQIPHDKHLAQGITCITCHAGVAHGTILERQVTIDGNFDSWDESKGRQNMPWQFQIVKMNQCVECHKLYNGPQACSACHTRIIKPITHLNPAWVQGGLHGQEAFKDISSCNRCHSYSLSVIASHFEDPILEYVRTNTFCADCHKNNKPQRHNQDWSWQHGLKAQDNSRICLICHNQGAKNKSDNSTKTICVSCHKGKHKIPAIHVVPLPKGTRPNTFCYQCHIENKCSVCHK